SHAAGAGLPALLRHTVLWADGDEVNVRSPEGRLLLLDHLLDQLDSPAQAVRQNPGIVFLASGVGMTYDHST
ncbi:hypothetical protein QA798_02580, partial [Mycolicibacterium fortuitum]|nr:hypothetical protein [Mycolicibacterium fortuitum]